MKTLMTVLAAFGMVALVGCSSGDEEAEATHVHEGHNATEMHSDGHMHSTETHAMDSSSQMGGYMDADSMHAGHEQASVLYACPMGCIEPRAEAGKCPVCGMILVMVTDASADSTTAMHGDHMDME